MKSRQFLAVACIVNLIGPSAQAAVIPQAYIDDANHDAILLSQWMTSQLKYVVPFNSTSGDVVPSQLKLFGVEVGAEGIVSGTKMDVDGLHNLPTTLVDPKSIDMFSRLPFPMVLGHAKVGLPFGFDAGVRFGGIPETNKTSGSTTAKIKNKVVGIDLRKKLIEEGALKPFGLTVGLSYTHADGSLDMTNTYNSKANTTVVPNHTVDVDNGTITDNAKWKTNSVGLQAIVDKKIAIITPYLGASVNRNSGNIDNSITTSGTPSLDGTAVPTEAFTTTGSSTDKANKWDVRALAGFELSILPFVKLGFGGEYAGQKNVAGSLGLRIQFR